MFEGLSSYFFAFIQFQPKFTDSRFLFFSIRGDELPSKPPSNPKIIDFLLNVPVLLIVVQCPSLVRWDVIGTSSFLDVITPPPPAPPSL